MILRNKIFLSLAAILVVTGFLGYSHVTQAAAGDIQVVLTREGDGAALAGANVLISCTGGTPTALTGAATTNGSGIASGAPQAGSDCQDGEDVILALTKDGYINRSVSSTYSSSANPNVLSTHMEFGYRITSITTQGTYQPITSATVKTGDGFGTTCITDSGVWYCAVPLADTGIIVSVEKDGYVTNTATSFPSDRVLATQRIEVAITDIQYGYKINNVSNELGALLLTGTAVYTGDAFGTTCYGYGTSNYCAIPLADTSTTISIVRDGYVTNTATSFAADRTSATDAQQTISVTGVQYGFKITGITTEGTNTALTTATVTTGDSFGTTCTADSGAWYCDIPLADTGVVVSVAKDGYVTDTTNSFASDRTVATHAQRTIAISDIKYALKVNTLNIDGSPLSSGTVTAGNGLSVSCASSGSSHYCPIPLATTGSVASLVTSTNPTVTGSYTLRTLASDPQSLITLRIAPQGGGHPVFTTVSTGSSSPVSTPQTNGAGGCVGTASFNVLTGMPCPPVTPVQTMTPNGTSPFMFTTYINAKSIKADIINLQNVLNTVIGSKLKKLLVVDGKWGISTINAIKTFQKSVNLKADGSLGPSTRVKLNERL